MVHFDSHPDMLLDRGLREKDIFNKEILHANLSIENWILPAVFAGHFNTIVWVKPHWATQIAEGHHHFAVGVETESQCLRVSCEVPYYIGEMLYCKEEEMEKIKYCDLYVVTLTENDAVGSESDNVKLVKDLIEKHDGRFVLDIDLDFFSTNNPFLENLESINGYEKLKPIYELEMDLSGDRTLYDVQNDRIRQIEPLSDFFSELEEIKDKDQIRLDLPRLLEKIENERRAELVKKLVSELLDSGIEVDWPLIHDAGCTFDTQETILPHHISTDEEITELVGHASGFLEQFEAPILVTIARSSTDNYCIPEQVDIIQERVLTFLRRRFDCNVIDAYSQDEDSEGS